MYTIEDLAQRIFSYTLEKQKYFAAAERALKKNLQSYMRPDLFGTSTGSVRLDNLLVAIASKFGSIDDEEKRIFLEDTVSEFISTEKADEIRDILETKLERKHNISGELSDKFVSTSKPLVDEEKKEFERVKNDIVKLISSNIFKFFEFKFKQYVHKKKKEQEGQKEISPDMETLPDSELLEKAEKEQEWQEGLVKDLFDLINKEIKKEKQYGYKMILLKRFMAKNKMSQEEIAEKIGIDQKSIGNWEKDLGKRLALFLSAAGLGPKFVNEGGLYKKDIKIPDSKEILKNKENLEDFKDFIEEAISKMQTGGRGGRKNEDLKKVMDLLAEGKSINEIVSEEIPKSRVYNAKKLYFNKWYKEWYESILKDVREASERIIKALIYINAETPPSPSHEKAVDQAIQKKFPLELTITFGANYDRQDLIKESDRIDPEKDDVDFKYKHYEVKLDRTSKPRVTYVYDQDLSDKGEFIGSPKSQLIIEGDPGNEILRRRLNDYVEEEMKPEGILPYGPSVKSRKPIRIPVEYVNESLDKTKTYDGVGKRVYKPFIDFADKYRGFMVEDEPHLTRVEEEGKREHKKLMPKGGKNEVRKLIQNLKENVDDEKSEKSPDQKQIQTWKDQIKELQDHLKKDDMEHLTKFIDKNKDRFKFAVSEERLKNVKELMKLKDLVENQKSRLLSRKIKGGPKGDDSLQDEIDANEKRIDELQKTLEQTKESFPAPESASVKKLFTELSNLEIKDKKLDGFLTSTDLQFFVNQVQGALAKEAQDSIAGIKKNKNMSDEERIEENKAIERKRNTKLNSFIELFEAVPADMKKRLEVFKTKDLNGYKKLQSRHGALLNWVDSPEKTLSKIKKSLSMPKPLVTPKSKQESVVPMAEEDAKFMLNWLENQLRGFSVIGDRFGKASLVANKMDPTDKKKVEDQLKKTEEEFQALRNRIAEMKDKKEKTPQEIEELQASIPGYMSTINSLKGTLSGSKGIPALIMAKVLSDRVSDFTRMFNPLSKTLWLKPVTYGKRAEIVTSKDEDKDTDDVKLITLQKNIATNASSLAKQHIFDKKSIQSLTKVLQSGLTKFKGMFLKMASLPYEKVLKDASFSYMTVSEKKLLDKKAEDDELFKERVKFVFPEGELNSAEKVINKLKEKKLDGASKKADKELRELTKSITNAYSDFDMNKIKALAKKEGISVEKAGVRLKRIKDSMAKYALSQFILRWQDVMDTDSKDVPKERGPMGGPASSKFDKILDMIEEDVPELFAQTPPEKELKDAPKGLPTPKEIRERLEKEFEEGFKEKTEREYVEFKERGHKVFKDPSGTSGGGSGGGGGGRKKPVKQNPPSHTYETIKHNFKNDLKTKSVHDIVLGEIGRYLHNIRNYVKGGTYFDVDDIVTGVVDILKNFKKVIKSLRVSTAPASISTRDRKAPPASDIKIENNAEAIKLFNKLSDIYKLLDMIASDEGGNSVMKIGPLPGDVSKIKTQRGEPDTWFPKGLMESYDNKSREDIEEGARKKAPKTAFAPEMAKRVSSEFLAFRLAHKFSPSDLQKIENLKITK